jgi:membrane protease YdiL (CAAX protease family)
MSNKTRGILVYLSIAFGLAWVLWEVPLRLGLSPRNPLFQLAVLPGAFAPAVATVVVRKWVTREGFDDAGLRLNLRQWRYYLVAWLLPLPVTAVIVALAVALGIGQPDFSLMRALSALAPEGTSLPSALPANLLPLIVVQSLVTALVATPILWGEEFGWRGYLQLRLLGQRPLLAAVTTGLIWGVWHYPINLRGYNFPDHPVLGLILFPVSTTLISIILGWLRLKTDSVWVTSLAHAATNAIGGSLTTLLFAGGPDPIFVTYLGVLGWLPLGALCAWIVFSGQLEPQPVGS